MTQPDDHRGWVQDPAGNWHQKRRMSTGARLTIAAVVASLVAGGFYWNWKQDQDRQQEMQERFACELRGGSWC